MGLLFNIYIAIMSHTCSKKSVNYILVDWILNNIIWQMGRSSCSVLAVLNHDFNFLFIQPCMFLA